MIRWSAQDFGAAAAIVLLAAVAILTSRPGAPVVERYASTDFHTSGYRAWAALLAREGVSTSRFILRPVELDDRIDTLISAQPPGTLSDLSTARNSADVAALVSWVRAGGRLVYIGRNLRLRNAEDGQLDLPFFIPGVGARGLQGGPLRLRAGSLQGLGADRMLLVEHAGRSELWDGNGDIVVRYALGRGEIVAVADPVPFTNANIVAPANARLAYLLGLPRKSDGGVAFDDGVHGALIDRPWYRALPLPVRVTLAILTSAALLALIGSAVRSGPPVSLNPAREPTSVEFVAAVAALYERIGARAAAANALAGEALRHVARANGWPDTLLPELIVARIEGQAGAAEVHELAALLGTPVPSDSALLASAQLAYAVRKKWSHGGYSDGRRAAFAGGARTRRRR